MHRRSPLTVVLLLLTLAPSADAQPAPPAAKPKTAVIDLAKIMARYEKQIEMKKKFDDELAPLRAQAEKIKQKLNQYRAEAQNPLSNQEQREVAAQNFKVEAGKLEQLDRDTKADLGKRVEARQTELWKEMQAAVAKHAEAEQIDVVIAYGDVPGQASDEFANVKRRMNSIDIGAGILFYSRPGIDITDAIVTRLNDTYRATQKKKTP
jgi:Skp family chaperone for outer membrane proteins